uniref:Uncharacterized protein n=1 Tax=Sander lucioperca TaxID=283035 RepID=A0A8C9XN76_SANLU
IFILLLTSDFHHTILGLHHQLFSVGHHGAHLAHKAHVRCHHGGPHVPRPVSAGECGEVLGLGWHAEGLVKDAMVPVTEWVPARGAEQGERNTSLSHGCCRWLRLEKPNINVVN